MWFELEGQKYTRTDIRRRHPNVSFPAGDFDPTPFGYTPCDPPVPPPPTEEQLIDLAKAAREQAVSEIVVTTVSGKTFDGDERSQDRMGRAISAMDEGDTILWVLADNTPTRVTRAELREALRLAGEQQTEIWVAPYL